MNNASYRFASAGLLILVLAGAAFGQLTPDQQADMTLTSAQKAFNEKNYPFAVARFREYLGKFPNQKAVNTARFGLALALLEVPEKEKNYPEVQQLLTPLAQDKTFDRQAAASYTLANTFRTLGTVELLRADANPAEAPQRRETAKRHFEQAAPFFAQALALYQAEAKAPGEAELSPEWEWVARSRCDLAEAQLRSGKVKEAQASAEPFLKDPNLSRSRYKDLGRYLYGHAAFLLGEMQPAQRTLTTLQPFTQPAFGTHARYLLARTQHLADERGEALANYEGAIDTERKNRELAALMLKEPQRFKSDPVKRAEFEAILKQPAQDHIARANFYLGVLLYEGGRFAEAKSRFQDFVKQTPGSPLKADAELRIGFCQVQLKDYAAALKTLQPLINVPALSDQARFWTAKAQIGLAPDVSTKFAEFKNAAVGAVGSYRAAHEAARALGDTPEIRVRRGEILLELADVLQTMKEAREAVNTYQAILAEKLLPERDEEVALRLAQAWHLAGDFNESDARCQAFLQKFPKSTLAPVVAFTLAENNFFRAAALEKTPPSPERTKQLAALYDETLKRMQVVLEKYPEYPKILLVRDSIGLTNYRKGDFEKAYKAWNEIPAPDRAGELTHVTFLMADCVLRQTPTSLAADADAIATGKLEEQLKNASELLEGFISANPKSVSAADALLKLGLCQQRRANLFSDAKDKQAILGAARVSYERLAKDFPAHPLVPNAVFERAKVMVQQGDVGGGMNELRRFTQDPLRQAKVAPLAAISLATLLRAQNKAPEAADILQKSREQNEANLAKDADRANLVMLLRYHQAAALREAGKLPEARALFDAVVKQSLKSAEGVEAALRFGQTLKEEGLLRIEAGKKLLQNPKETAKGQNEIGEGFKIVRDAGTYLESTADQLKAEPSFLEPRARMLYEAAWVNRIVAGPEIEAAQLAVAKDLAAKAGPAAAKLPLPRVALHQTPVTPAEKKARDLYKSLIDQFGETPLSLDARFELAELQSQRNELDAAAALLNDVLDKEPNVDLTEKIRLRLGAVFLAKGNTKGAMAQFEAVARNPKSQNLGWALYRSGDVLIAEKQYPEAIKRLVTFRDNGQYQNIPGLSDRALLRLGHAYALQKAWPESYQAFERVAAAFPNSPWIDDARYGMGWALQQQKNHDAAVNNYLIVVGRTAAELGAKAQFQIGVCRLEQKRFPDAATAFLAVPTTYDYPELSAAALLEAATAYRESGNREQMVRLLERVTRDYPGTPFAEAAKERLEAK